MIKLFGWEKRVQDDIDQKRKLEMDLATRVRMINTANFFVKYVLLVCLSEVIYLTTHAATLSHSCIWLSRTRLS